MAQANLRIFCRLHERGGPPPVLVRAGGRFLGTWSITASEEVLGQFPPTGLNRPALGEIPISESPDDPLGAGLGTCANQAIMCAPNGVYWGASQMRKDGKVIY